MSRLAADTRTRPVGHRIQARSTLVPVDAGRRRLEDALTARIAATRRRLLAGGLLQEVEWGIPGEPDVRGRRTFTYSMLDVLIEQRPALDRGTLDTDRADNTVLMILDPLAITDEHTFRWGEPLHVYKVKKIDGLLQNEETCVRVSSEVTVLR